MFTGIVEQMGSVASAEDLGAGRRLVVGAPLLEGTRVGASVAVNGVCLTAADARDAEVTVDVVAETLSRSNLGRLRPGDRVNLERPLGVDGRLDGHIVQGHVDGTGEVRRVDPRAGGTFMTIASPESLLTQIVEKGSVAVDGVSLTVAKLVDAGFEVALIPHTLETTTLGLRKPGDLVNLETDIVAKYVGRLLEHSR